MALWCMEAVGDHLVTLTYFSAEKAQKWASQTSIWSATHASSDAPDACGGSTLVVDDSPERLEFFRERLPGCMVATSYDEAVAALGRRRFRTVFLDCDILGSRSGADIAYWMTRRLARARRPRVIVQSTNGRGALAIEVTLRSAGFDVEAQPFPP